MKTQNKFLIIFIASIQFACINLYALRTVPPCEIPKTLDELQKYVDGPNFIVLTDKSGKPIPVNEKGEFTVGETALTDDKNLASMSITNLGIDLTQIKKQSIDPNKPDTYMLHEDQAQIDRLVTMSKPTKNNQPRPIRLSDSCAVNDATCADKMKYQKIMTFFVVQVETKDKNGKITTQYMKFYMNDPFPGGAVATSAGSRPSPARQVIDKYQW